MGADKTGEGPSEGAGGPRSALPTGALEQNPPAGTCLHLCLYPWLVCICLFRLILTTPTPADDLLRARALPGQGPQQQGLPCVLLRAPHGRATDDWITGQTSVSSVAISAPTGEKHNVFQRQGRGGAVARGGGVAGCGFPAARQVAVPQSGPTRVPLSAEAGVVIVSCEGAVS